MRFIYGLFLLLLLQVSCYAGDLREDATISFANPDGTKTENLKTEIARTEPERSKGLMYRRDLKDGT